jgi:hypothetical protein
MAKEEKAAVINKFVDLAVKIKKVISETANEGAINKFVQKSVDAELDRRAEILEKGFTVWQNTEKELKKCVEDVTNHVSAGENGDFVQQRSYSDARFKERTALKRKLADIEVALMLAFGENQDYSKLEELTKKGNSGKDQKSDKEQKKAEE